MRRALSTWQRSLQLLRVALRMRRVLLLLLLLLLRVSSCSFAEVGRESQVARQWNGKVQKELSKSNWLLGEIR